MPTERPAQRLRDIIANIGRIRDHVRGMDEKTFLEDGKTLDAVERCLERIAEASRKIGKRYDGDYPELHLAALRDFGSKLRHDYDVIEPRRLWGFARERLDPLEAMARTELAKLADEEGR